MLFCLQSPHVFFPKYPQNKLWTDSKLNPCYQDVGRMCNLLKPKGGNNKCNSAFKDDTISLIINICGIVVLFFLLYFTEIRMDTGETLVTVQLPELAITTCGVSPQILTQE